MKGFTLIEVLIALGVFAILSTLTAISMSNAFNTRERVSAQMDRISALDLSLTILNRDSIQITNRSVRDVAMRIKPAFIGQANYMEFTRSGLTNPKAQEKRSTLKRIAILCNKGTLIRRAFARLDAVNANAFEDKILMKNLQNCEFQYLGSSNQWTSQWINILSKDQSKQAVLPKALQIHLTIKNWGPLSLVFVIPEGLYASIV